MDEKPKRSEYFRQGKNWEISPEAQKEIMDFLDDECFALCERCSIKARRRGKDARRLILVPWFSKRVLGNVIRGKKSWRLISDFFLIRRPPKTKSVHRAWKITAERIAHRFNQWQLTRQNARRAIIEDIRAALHEPD